MNKSIRGSFGGDTMNTLEWLFPALTENREYTLPSWDDFDKPWSIFRESLKSQINAFVDSEDGIFIHEDANIGDFVRIEGPCYIGAGAEIRHAAYIREGTWICEYAIVGHASEIKNSILLPESKAPHFNYVGDSILGFGVNLGAGSKLSNVRNDRGEIVVTLKDGSRFNTGLNKLGALIGDGSQLGCNVVTNPGSLLEPNSMVSPNNTITGLVQS